jgi:hypothetical protein
MVALRQRILRYALVGQLVVIIANSYIFCIHRSVLKGK